MPENLIERVRKLQRVANEQGLVLKEIAVMQTRTSSIYDVTITPEKILGVKITTY